MEKDNGEGCLGIGNTGGELVEAEDNDIMRDAISHQVYSARQTVCIIYFAICYRDSQ